MACRNVNVHNLSKFVRYFSQKTTEQGNIKYIYIWYITSKNNNFNSMDQIIIQDTLSIYSITLQSEM